MNRRIATTTMALGVPALILIGLVLVPISYEVRVGSLVRAEWPAASGDLLAIANDISRLENLANRNIVVQDGTVVLEAAFRKVGERDAEGRLREALGRHLDSGSAVRIETEEIVRKVGGNALAAMTGGTITVNAEGLSDAEVEAAIAAELANWGARASEVRVQTSADGQRTIDITIDEAPAESVTVEVNR
ncbi:MAG: hypothetical protein ACE5G2_04835 [Candidatus Krumholzibacteriia bacterium]